METNTNMAITQIKIFSNKLDLKRNEPVTLIEVLDLYNEMYVLRVNDDFTNVWIETIQLPTYPRRNELIEKIVSKNLQATAKDIRNWGFAELVDEFDKKRLPAFGAPDCQEFNTITGTIEDDAVVDIFYKEDNQYFADLLLSDTLQFRILKECMYLVYQQMDKKGLVAMSLDRTIIKTKMNYAESKIKGFQTFLSKFEKSLSDRGLKFDYINDRQDIELNIFCRKYYVNSRPFAKILLSLTSVVNFRKSICSLDEFKWRVNFQRDIPLINNERIQHFHEINSLEDALQTIFIEPDDTKKESIVQSIKTHFDKEITSDDILFDINSECYFLSETVEKELLNDILPEIVSDMDEVYKYTTFNTAVEILKSGKLRLNSIVSMNDKTETDFMTPYIQNFDDTKHEIIDRAISADRTFIVSLTGKLDKLDMWRLYGDDTRGVCLAFEHKIGAKNLIEIKYVDPRENETLHKISAVLRDLKGSDEKLTEIKFMFALLLQNRHYIKHIDYVNENEYRVLEESLKPNGWFMNNSNGILTPYIEKDIRDNEKRTDDFPLKLTGIILGNNVTEKETNLAQLYYLASHSYGGNLGFGISSVTSYR